MSVTWRYTPPSASPLAAIEAAGAHAVKAAAEVILAHSQPLVPVDTGELKASGRVSVDGTTAAVSYEGIAPDGFDYGIKVHEDMTLNHPNGGQAKYLEQALHASVDEAAQIIATTIREAIGL